MYNVLVDIVADVSTAVTMEDFFNTFLTKKNDRMKYISIWFTVKPLTFRMEKSANYPYHLLRMIYSFYIYAGTASFGGSHPNAFNFFKYAWIFRSALN